MVPYRSNGSGRAMMARAMTTSGTRAMGRMPVVRGAGGRAPAPGPGLTYQSPKGLPFIPYEAAKRMHLGGLGAAGIAPPTGAGAGKGAEIGATQGATYGSYGGPIAAAIGAVVGAIGGAIAGSINKRDPEQYNFDQAVALWQQNPDNVFAIGNKYLPLAGLFDLSLKNPHIPIYQRYGRMGEERFVVDLVKLISSAANQGQITASDTPLTIMTRIVQPWIDSWGYGPMVDPHADLINRLMVGMILDYVSGNQGTWLARGGDIPASFKSLPAFSLPKPAASPQPVMMPQPVVMMPQPAPVLAPPVVTPLPAVHVATPSATASQAPATGTTLGIPTPIPPTTTNVPSGFNQVATDQAGNPVFANPQGVLYSWNGTAMQQFTGQLATGTSQAAQVQAAIQAALAQGYSAAQAAQSAIAQQQAAGVQVPPAIVAQAPAQAATTAAAPTVTTAGIGGALSGPGGIIAVGLTLVGLLFATARPAPGRKGRRHA